MGGFRFFFPGDPLHPPGPQAANSLEEARVLRPPRSARDRASRLPRVNRATVLGFHRGNVALSTRGFRMAEPRVVAF